MATEREVPDHHHRDVQGGAARAAVFGISDGLVTNVSLIIGVAGAETAGNYVRLAGFAGLLAGAFSMAAGEYISMQAQRELLQRELKNERTELARNPKAEHQELTAIYEARGIAPDRAADMATQMMKTPEMALETHAREELGVDPESLGSPMQAAGSSFLSFTIGAIIPLFPWFFTRGVLGEVLSLVLAAVTALAIGAGLGHATGRGMTRSALRQLAVSMISAGAAFVIGRLIGVNIS